VLINHTLRGCHFERSEPCRAVKAGVEFETLRCARVAVLEIFIATSDPAFSRAAGAWGRGCVARTSRRIRSGSDRPSRAGAFFE